MVPCAPRRRRRRCPTVDPATEPDSPRLLVHRPGSPPHHRHRATTRIHSQLSHRPEQRHRQRL